MIRCFRWSEKHDTSSLIVFRPNGITLFWFEQLYPLSRPTSDAFLRLGALCAHRERQCPMASGYLELSGYWNFPRSPGGYAQVDLVLFGPKWHVVLNGSPEGVRSLSYRLEITGDCPESSAVARRSESG